MWRPRLPRLIHLGATLALLVSVAVVVAIVLATQGSAGTNTAAASSNTSGATTVQRRDLVATDTESGTLGYANPQTVYNRLSGTITWLPSVGQVIKPGDALFKVDGQPVILMNGATPAYRDLNASDSAGPDVLELNRNLVALGFNPSGIVVDDVWQAATTQAVDVFQESLGETPTGSLSLGQVVFLPGDQVVSSVEATLGSTGGGGSGAPSSGTNASTLPAASAEFVSLKTTPQPKQRRPNRKSSNNPSTSKSAKNVTSLKGLIALLRAEIAELKAAKSGGSPSSSHGSPSSSHSGSPSSSNSGSPSPSSGGSPSAGGGGSATAVLQTSSTQLVATVDLNASKQSEAKVGEKVTVEMPAGNTVDGTITAVSPVAQSSSSGNSGSGGGGNSPGGNGSSSATIPVTIALKGQHTGAGLDQAAVSVNFVQSQARNVLAIPVTALLATAGGGYAVQAAGTSHKLIPVSTGLFAGGYVEISGPGIYPGLAVTDSQG